MGLTVHQFFCILPSTLMTILTPHFSHVYSLIRVYTPVFRRDVLWYADVYPGLQVSVSNCFCRQFHITYISILNAVTCIMYNAHKLTHYSSEYTVYFWICKVYSLKKKNILHISVSCNLITSFKEKFPNAQVFVNFSRVEIFICY